MGLHSRSPHLQIDSGQAAPARHAKIFDHYLAWLDEPSKPDHRHLTISIIARSPTSPVILAFVEYAEKLKAYDVAVRAIIAQTEPAEPLRDLTKSLLALSGESQTGELARWANKTCLLDAHEQMTLGPAMCWSGDAMRRQPGKCDGLDLFETEAPQTVRLGVLAFEAIWLVCEKLPGQRGDVNYSRLSASCAHPEDPALAAFSYISRIDAPPITRH